jgi:hypothetical protein
MNRALIFVIAVVLSCGAYAGTSPYAETVILNGKVITADSDDPDEVSFKEAIAIQGDRIMAVGSNAEIRKLVADWTEVIDAKGNSVIPGLIDTHNHIYETSTGFPWVIRSIPELLVIRVRGESISQMVEIMGKAIQARSRQISRGKWVRIRLDPASMAVQAFGTHITRASLDGYAPNHPVFVRTRGGSVLNTQAIKAIENYYGNELPEGYWMQGREIGWSGEYTDFSRCTSIDLIGAQDEATFNKYIKGYFEVMQANAQIGVTTHKSHLQCEGGFSASSHLDRNDLMPIRMAWGHRWMQPFSDHIKETYRRIGDWTGYGSDFLWSIGSSVGGIDAGGVGWCTSMPADDSIKSREQCPPSPPGLFIEAITEINTVPNRARRTEHLTTLALLAAEGRISGIPGWHVSGDGALELMFQTYRAAMADERIRALRIQSDHCHTVTAEQIQIAARLNHTFSCDATDTPTNVILEGYGEEYLAMNAPVASMLKAGVNTVISEYGIQRELRSSPFEDGVMWLTRKINGETWGIPEEAVPDRMTLLLMMTRYGAYPLWKENDLGSIEAGKLADIVILNGDYMAGPKEELDKLTSVMTFIGGKVSYEASELRGNTFRFNTDTADWTVEMNTPTSVWRWQKAPEIPPFLNGAGGI